MLHGSGQVKTIIPTRFPPHYLPDKPFEALDYHT